MSLSYASAAKAFGLVIIVKMRGDLLQSHAAILINLSNNIYGYTLQCNVNHEVFWHVVIWRVNFICTIKCRCCVSLLFIITTAYFPAVTVSGNTEKNLQLAKTETKVLNKEFLTQI